LEDLIYSDDFGKPSYNLDIPERREVLDALFHQRDFNDPNADESSLIMLQRYEDMTSEFPEELREPHILLMFKYWLTRRVGVIDIQSGSDDYAYAIFEAMNDRGRPLSPTDMLKAYLLAKLDDPNSRQKANLAWKQQVQRLHALDGEPDPERDAKFISAWLRAQHAESIRLRTAGAENKDWELIGSTFNRWVRDNKAKLGLGNPSDHERLIYSGFIRYARVYEQIIQAQDTFTKGLDSVFYNAHNAFTWQPTILLAPIRDGDDEEVVRKKLLVTATYLDVWLIRRVVNYIRIGYSTVQYAMYLLVTEIRRKPLEELVAILIERLQKDDVTLSGAKDGERRGIRDLRLNQFSKRYMFHVLARLSSHVETASDMPNRFPEFVCRSSDDPYDIEHVWADRFEDHKQEFPSKEEFHEFRDYLGGLLLLPSSFNRSFQDLSYEDKLQHYSAQNLLARTLKQGCYANNPRFIRYVEQSGHPFRPYAHFTKAEQLERRELYHQLAEEIWNPKRLIGEANL